MRIKSLMKNKKAFSAIIAALILMLIAVAAGVVVYAYVMGWIGGVQTNPPASGIITIESFTNDGNDGILYIRNHGTTGLTIDTLYINDVLLYNDGTYYETLTAIDTTLETGLTDITLTDFKVKSGDLVKIVCTDGTTVSQTLTK